MVDQQQDKTPAEEKKDEKRVETLKKVKLETKSAVENEKTGKRELTGIVQQTPLYRKGPRGRKEIVAGGITESSKRKEGKSDQNNIITANKKRKDYAS